MATIIEYHALWNLTDAAAEHMVEKDLITKCNESHEGTIETDLPVYHIHRQAPNWFGFTTIPSAINDAEMKVS